jgi:two-component sensor histidine kinase
MECKASMDEMENVFSRMQRVGSELLDSKNILFHFEVDEKMNHTKLDMAHRKNFYLIFKEALNNAAKYAQCKNVGKHNPRRKSCNHENKR